MPGFGRNDESTLNVYLAEALRGRHPRWTTDCLVAERTGVLRQKAKRPDIAVSMPGCPPVIVETEVSPGRQVEQEAIERLGRKKHASGRPGESAIAVVLPDHLLEGDPEAAAECEFSYAAFSTEGQEPGTGVVNVDRFPEGSAWLTGDVNDLAAAIE